MLADMSKFHRAVLPLLKSPALRVTDGTRELDGLDKIHPNLPRRMGI